MVDISRHRPIINPLVITTPIHIIGCGATGSWVSTILAKMGFSNLHLYDFDKVEVHNLANQNFTTEDVGKFKAESLKNLLTKFNEDVIIDVKTEAVDKSYRFKGIVFLLTDSMASRKEIYENCIRNKIDVNLMIETRMSSTQGIIYSIRPGRVMEQRGYEQTYYEDETAEVSLCGTPISVLPTAMAVASQAVWQMINFLKNDEYSQEIIIDFKDMDMFKQNIEIL